MDFKEINKTYSCEIVGNVATLRRKTGYIPVNSDTTLVVWNFH